MTKNCCASPSIASRSLGFAFSLASRRGMATLGGSGEAVGMGSGVGEAVGVAAGLAAVAGVVVKARQPHAAAIREPARRMRFKIVVLLQYISRPVYLTHGTWSLLRVGFGARYHARQFRHDLEEIADDDQVGKFADRHCGVAVNR